MARKPANNSVVEALRKALEKHFKDSAEIFPTFNSIKTIEVIKSQSSIINAVTGIGGFPRGRVTEVFGPESSGKTTFAIDTSISVQKNVPNGKVLFLDFEHAIDIRYAHSLGLDLDPDNFILAQPDYFEQGAQIADAFIEKDLVDMIVIDSAAAMTPKDELEGAVTGAGRIGLQSALMAKFLSRMTKILSRGRKPALVILNQTRAKIDMKDSRNSGGEEAAGGKALKFYTSIRLSLEIVKNEGDSRRGTVGIDQVYTQNRVRVVAVKNKLAVPFIRAQLVLEYGKGINNIVSIAELAEAKLGIMSAAGGYVTYQGDTPETSLSCRGRETFQEHLKGNPTLLQEIERKVLETMKQEHARELGIKEITIGEEAKIVEEGEDTEPLLLLGDNSVPRGLGEGEGLPLED